ncbi:MAG: hypothetical protein AAGF12_02780 [Myxococcota bacterium]
MARLSLALLLALFPLSACVADSLDESAGAQQSLINGSAGHPTYRAVGLIGDGNGEYGCSAVLVAPRVMLTSAHCVLRQSIGCGMAPATVRFAEANGGWSDQASFNSRIATVIGVRARPEIVDLSTCSEFQDYNCIDPSPSVLDLSRELTVLYLDRDAPADVTSLPVLVHPAVGTSEAAGEFGSMVNLENWVAQNQPLVTTVGYGVGNMTYPLTPTLSPRGRSYGVQRWLDTSFNFGSHVTDCDTRVAGTAQPAVEVAPDDLTWAMVPTDLDDWWDIAPGATFNAQQAQTSQGDSGGPALLGPGPSSNGLAPDPLPSPGNYDPTKNYIIGTASRDAGQANTPGAAFAPTWTWTASTFLMSALHDTDGDGLADPVDGDIDGDGCLNGVDDDPQNPLVRDGIAILANCSPGQEVTYSFGGVDTDNDNLLHCEDDDDDGDMVPDAFDPCPLSADDICVTVGDACPWDGEFFDCRLAGCLETFLKIEWLINPPLQELLAPVLASEAGVVVIRAIEGMTLEETAFHLLGGETRRGVTQHVLLHGMAADGTSIPLALADQENLEYLSARGANALQITIARDGQSFVAQGIVFEGR